MIKRFFQYFSGVKPVWIDGSIYVMMAVTSANAGMLSSDNAAKYISAETLFYLLWVNIALDGALLALKMFRSTAFADHKLQEKNDTDFFRRNPQTPKP